MAVTAFPQQKPTKERVRSLPININIIRVNCHQVTAVAEKKNAIISTRTPKSLQHICEQSCITSSGGPLWSQRLMKTLTTKMRARSAQTVSCYYILVQYNFLTFTTPVLKIKILSKFFLNFPRRPRQFPFLTTLSMSMSLVIWLSFMSSSPCSSLRRSLFFSTLGGVFHFVSICFDLFRFGHS